MAFDASGALLVADTARGALWKVALGADGTGAKPVLVAQNALLEGADGLAVDRRGDVWVAVNELNAIVKVTPAGQVQQVARNDVAGPLEFPSGLVFVGDAPYVSNFDTPRRHNPGRRREHRSRRHRGVGRPHRPLTDTGRLRPLEPTT
ncbi:MAG: SMP-30/gluconolactonase/LRE family protein [Betaproteobacteria bacterium]|nr:SMP-30/gluconolactonase/LRE family protein [Betaproteobacteria bacterium]